MALVQSGSIPGDGDYEFGSDHLDKKDQFEWSGAFIVNGYSQCLAVVHEWSPGWLAAVTLAERRFEGE